MLNILCEEGTKFASRCWGLLLENFRAIGRSFDVAKTHDYVTKYGCHMYFKFSFRYMYLCRVSQQIKIFHVQENFFTVD